MFFHQICMQKKLNNSFFQIFAAIKAERERTKKQKQEESRAFYKVRKNCVITKQPKKQNLKQHLPPKNTAKMKFLSRNYSKGHRKRHGFHMQSTVPGCKKSPSRAMKILKTVVTSAELNGAKERSLRSLFRTMAKYWGQKSELEKLMGKEIRIVFPKPFYRTTKTSLRDFMLSTIRMYSKNN